MKHIFTFTVCALALLLALTGCNIAPTPAETTEEITQGELTSEEVTTEAVTTKKKEVNTDLGDVPSDDITVIQGKNKDEFLQEYENSEVSKNGYFSVKNDIIGKTLAITEFSLVKVLYREYSPELNQPGFMLEADWVYFLGEDLYSVGVTVDYDISDRHYEPSSLDIPFDESNGIYHQKFGKKILYTCYVNDRFRITFLIPEAVENH